MITEDTLKTILEKQGYNTENFDDLLELVKSQINSRVPIEPVEQKQSSMIRDTKCVLLDFFPVSSITSVYIGETEFVDGKNCYIDLPDGIIYFKEPKTGLFKASYKTGLPKEEYDKYIIPLIYDMLKYNLTDAWNKDASSIKEGDVSVNYDTSISLGALIQKRLDTLEAKFNTWVRMI